MKGRVYIHKNKSNGKIYVGKTTQRPYTKRWGKNGSGYKKNKQFYKDIEKYGWSNFEHVILPEVHTTQESLNEAERSYIRIFDSVRNGYNRTYGGNVNQPKPRPKNKYGTLKNPYPRNYNWRAHNIK